MPGLLQQDFLGDFLLGSVPATSATVEQALRRFLLDAVSVPVFYARRPQDIADLPCCVFEKVSEERSDTTDGRSGSAVYTYVLRIWSMDRHETLTLAADIRRNLDGFSGMFWSRWVPSAWLDSEDDDVQESRDGEDIYGRHVTYSFIMVDQN